MYRVLFVEDNLELIDEIAELLEEVYEEIEISYATDVISAWQMITEHEKPGFDLILLDIMLPAVKGSEAHKEGVYLAAWVKGTERPEEHLQLNSRPDWITESRPKILFLTSLGKNKNNKFVSEKLNQDFPEDCFIERLIGDAWDHCKIIQKHLES